MNMIETDYLVIGAGAAGMSFTDSLIDADRDCDVVMVDRRHVAGGHWNDAYSFVRLHQPAACYGVNSTRLGNDQLDERGLNAGLYQQADGVQICDYFHRVMEQRLVGSGQVRFFPMSNYLGLEASDVAFVSTLTGAMTKVTVRRAIVDARYLEPTIPSRHRPSFTVDADIRCIPINDLPDVKEPPTGYTIIGGGKTGADACTWLLEGGVDPGDIRWIRTRDAWMWNRAHVQPLDLVTDTVGGFSLAVEASAEAVGIDDLFARLEACGHLLRLDPSVSPTMYHGATFSVAEGERLRSIDDVVRLGHIHHIGVGEIALEQGTIRTDREQLYVDCSAVGLCNAPPHPIFEPGRITLQCIGSVHPTFNAAVIGYLEASRGDDQVAKARLAPTTRYPDKATDWIPNMRGQLESLSLWNSEQDVVEWLESSRLNFARGMFDKASEPRMGDAITRLLTFSERAIANLGRLHGIQP